MDNADFELYERYNMIKGTCKSKKEKVYLLIRKDNLNVIRMAWAENHYSAANYFDKWLSGLTDSITLKDCFIVKVWKRSVN